MTRAGARHGAADLLDRAVRRRLALRRESLAELSFGELSGVAGASLAVTCVGCTNRTCPSLDYCPTLPIRECPVS